MFHTHVTFLDANMAIIIQYLVLLKVYLGMFMDFSRLLMCFLQLLRVYLFILALLLSMSAIYALRVTIRSRNECFIYKMCA